MQLNVKAPPPYRNSQSAMDLTLPTTMSKSARSLVAQLAQIQQPLARLATLTMVISWESNQVHLITNVRRLKIQQFPSQKATVQIQVQVLLNNARWQTVRPVTVE